ncbi:ABC transporter substrate-binding protein [Pseudactinotalea terrae]|uniref:ABC transporter substrate-binding protein n=1 Tax=Pseudactinotalea terrae TaxID=1743262 RepID=UPI0012E1B7A7|nr:extracellular solute-binding protein [Pseudactinotalea terrae]
MSRTSRFMRSRLAPAVAGAAALALIVTACGPAGGDSDDSTGGDADGGATEFSFLTITENPQISEELTRLSEGACADANAALPLTIESIPQAEVNNRVPLLASQDALPVMFISPTTESKVGGDMYESGKLLDLEATFDELGIMENVLPAAAETVKTIYGSMVSVPFQYNIEGFWYNKEVFAANGIEVPTTWADFKEAAATLDAAGLQPLTAAGTQGWTITRYLSSYLARSQGVDALQNVVAGDAGFADPEYLEAIQEVASLGEAGYFGEGLTSRDSDTMTSQFFAGNVGMMYNGSWTLSSVYDEGQNPLGPDAFGFFPFPEVEGGSGSIADYPANTGTVTALSADLYNDKVGDWLVCISENYGSSLMENQGAISGFAQNTEVETPELVSDIVGQMEGATGAVIWFEAPFGARFGDAAGTNAGPLLDGGISPEDYASLLDEAIAADG